MPQIIVAVLLTAAATGVVMRQTWQDDSWTALWTFDARFLLAAAALVAFAWIVDAARLQAICRALGYRVPPSVAFRTNLLGYFLSAITPFTSGGGPLQVYSLTRAGVPVGHGTAVVLVSGFIAHLSLAVAGIALVFGSDIRISFHPGIDRWIRAGFLVYTGGIITLSFLVWHVDRARRFIRAVVRGVLRIVTDAERVQSAASTVDRVVVDLHNGLRRAARHKGWALLGFGAYPLYFLAMFATVPTLAAGLGGKPPFWDVTAVQVPIFLFASVLPTPGGTGGLEFGLASGLVPYLPSAQIGIVVATWRLVTFYAVVAVSGMAVLMFIRSELVRAARNGARAREMNSDDLTNSTDATVTDATVTDSTVTDAIVTDATVTDTTVTDATVTDATVTDATVTDATVTDATVTDATVTDATVTDATVTDSTVTDAIVTDSTVTDATVTDATVTDATVRAETADTSDDDVSSDPAAPATSDSNRRRTRETR